MNREATKDWMRAEAARYRSLRTFKFDQPAEPDDHRIAEAEYNRDYPEDPGRDEW